MKIPKPNSSLILAISFLSFSSASTSKTTTLITSSTSKFGGAIEGASVNVNGDIFATNFNAELFSIGSITPSQSLYHSSTSKLSYYNGIRFLPLTKSQIDQGIKSVAMLADMNENQVTKIVEGNDGKIEQSAYCKDPTLFLPNDLAYGYQSGRIYISGQNYTANTIKGDGGLWICEGGKIIEHQEFGRTNGIELSSDEKVLYLSEAFNKDLNVTSNKIWKFDIDQTGKVSNQQLFADFEKIDGTQSIDVDGMRIDIDGNLYVTRHGGSQVVVFSPQSEILSRIDLNSIKRPTNLEFGGEDGKTLFIVGACVDNDKKGCVDTIQNDKPGRAFIALKSLNGKN